MKSLISYCINNNKIHISSSMKFAIENKALYISIKNPVYGLKSVVYCSIYKNTNAQCNKQAAISIQGTLIYMQGATHTGRSYVKVLQPHKHQTPFFAATSHKQTQRLYGDLPHLRRARLLCHSESAYM